MSMEACNGLVCFRTDGRNWKLRPRLEMAECMSG